MYIKEVIIDGFKSYAQRVTLSNFDPGFNAITGLNGSGKSNILDSICFLLGIKTLSHVSKDFEFGCRTSLGRIHKQLIRCCLA
jgi:structural maintenance of chromosome 2